MIQNLLSKIFQIFQLVYNLRNIIYNIYKMNSRNISKNEQKKEFENLKSDFIFKKIISFMERNKSLSIMQYNKKLQKRLNININDYRECAKIEIELKLVEGEYGKFINIPKKDKEYYHIYFDNSNKDDKRRYVNYYEKVKMIKIIIDYQAKSFEKLFFLISSFELSK